MSKMTKLTGIVLAGLLAAAYSITPAKSAAANRGVVDAGTSLGVSVSGPTRMGPSDACRWSASVSGGTAPYTYSWQGGSFQEGPTSNTVSWMSSTGPVHVTVSVTDGASGQAGDEMWAQVDEEFTGCGN